MNPRSIHFRLTLYQVTLVALTLSVFALASYWGFRRHLISTLESQCASQTKQIADSLLSALPASGITYVQDEIQEHFAPEANNLSIRIVGSNGTSVYESGDPHDKSFTPPPCVCCTSKNLALKWTPASTGWSSFDLTL